MHVLGAADGDGACDGRARSASALAVAGARAGAFAVVAFLVAATPENDEDAVDHGVPVAAIEQGDRRAVAARFPQQATSDDALVSDEQRADGPADVDGAEAIPRESDSHQGQRVPFLVELLNTFDVRLLRPDREGRSHCALGSNQCDEESARGERLANEQRGEAVADKSDVERRAAKARAEVGGRCHRGAEQPEVVAEHEDLVAADAGVHHRRPQADDAGLADVEVAERRGDPLSVTVEDADLLRARCLGRHNKAQAAQSVAGIVGAVDVGDLRAPHQHHGLEEVAAQQGDLGATVDAARVWIERDNARRRPRRREDREGRTGALPVAIGDDDGADGFGVEGGGGDLQRRRRPATDEGSLDVLTRGHKGDADVCRKAAAVDDGLGVACDDGAIRKYAGDHRWRQGVGEGDGDGDAVAVDGDGGGLTIGVQHQHSDGAGGGARGNDDVEKCIGDGDDAGFSAAQKDAHSGVKVCAHDLCLLASHGISGVGGHAGQGGHRQCGLHKEKGALTRRLAHTTAKDDAAHADAGDSGCVGRGSNADAGGVDEGGVDGDVVEEDLGRTILVREEGTADGELEGAAVDGGDVGAHAEQARRRQVVAKAIGQADGLSIGAALKR